MFSEMKRHHQFHVTPIERKTSREKTRKTSSYLRLSQSILSTVKPRLHSFFLFSKSPIIRLKLTHAKESVKPHQTMIGHHGFILTLVRATLSSTSSQNWSRYFFFFFFVFSKFLKKHSHYELHFAWHLRAHRPERKRKKKKRIIKVLLYN